MDDPEHPRRRRSLKRSFDQISRSPPPQQQEPQEPNRIRQPAWTTTFANAVRNSSFGHTHNNTPRPDLASEEREQPTSHPSDTPRRRFVGDGIDARRPVMSDTTVIDLTGSDSPENQPLASMRRYPGGLPPRLNREPSVIDLDVDFEPDETEAPTPPVDLTGNTTIDLEDGEDDDVQYMGSHPLPQAPNIPPYHHHHHHPLHTTSPFALSHLLSFVPSRLSRYEYAERQARETAAARRFDRRWAQFERGIRLNERAAGMRGANGNTHRGRTHTSARPMEPRVATGPLGSFNLLAQLGNFQSIMGMGTAAQIRLPDLINHEAVAFDTVTGAPTRSQRPHYSPPPAVQDGFTRSPREGDLLVCPNCDHELGTGEGIDKQVWVVRDCGHVYCGFCANTRQQQGGKKAIKVVKSLAERPRKQEKLKTCVVDDCTGKTSGAKKMFQVWASVD